MGKSGARKRGATRFVHKKRHRECKGRQKTKSADLAPTSESLSPEEPSLLPSPGTELPPTLSCGDEDVNHSVQAVLDKFPPAAAAALEAPLLLPVLSLPREEINVSENGNAEADPLTGSSSPQASEPQVERRPVSVNELLMETSKRVQLFLPKCWLSIVSDQCLNVMCLSKGEEKAIQRRLGFRANGQVSLSVHGRPIDTEPHLKGLHLPGPMTTENLESVVDFVVTFVNRIRELEICSGADRQDYKAVWCSTPDGYIDQDFFKECRYKETFRSSSCKFLVVCRAWRCSACNMVDGRLRKRVKVLDMEEPHPMTPNIHLSEKQKLNKFKEMKKEAEAQRKKIDSLQKKISLLIQEEGMYVDNELGEMMQTAVQDQKLDEFQSLFFQQQLKAANAKSKSGMRWHPQMIRFALAIFMASPAAYGVIVDSGMMRLPHSRTLYDYSHVFEAKEGICMPIIQSICEKIKKNDQEKFTWHVLLCDEMHISKNIVYHKMTGELAGFARLDPVEKALQELTSYMDNAEEAKPAMASKMLSFMVVGVCSSVKEVVASFSIDSLNKEKMYTSTWDVICNLERSGIRIICMTSDGNAVNRSFFKMNTPITRTDSGLVFDTINKAAPSRPLYFMSDVPHLIKTIRNNFYNSRPGKKNKRCLTKNGQQIVWNTIIRLYNLKKEKTLRKSYKLNHANVFPDSYSCMKVGYAFAVLSKTVAEDIDAQGWPHVSETVQFIHRVNNMADCLNGAHPLSGIKTANPLLNPYRSPEDSRFQVHLLSFLDYLREWKNEVEGQGNVTQGTLNDTAAGDESFSSLHDLHEIGGIQENIPAHKRLLCYQTLEGVELAIRGFIGSVTYLLKHGGVDYVNARVFCQDALEQFFSKQRAKGGSSNTPNVMKFNSNAVGIHLQKGLGVKKRKGNTEICDVKKIHSSPLAKRKKCFSLE